MAVSGNSPDTVKNWWLDITEQTNLEDSTLNIWDSAYDANEISTQLVGLAAFILGNSGSSSLQGDKFQLTEQEGYSGLKDYRWADGDTVDLYILNQAANGNLVWTKENNRTLKSS